MKIRIKWGHHTKNVLLFPAQTSLLGLEAKTRLTFDLTARYLVFSYWDPKGNQTLILNEDEFAIMLTEFSSGPLGTEWVVPEITVQKLSHFIRKNKQFCIKKTLQVYFAAKLRQLASVRVLQQEIQLCYETILGAGVGPAYAQEIVASIVVQFLRDFQSQTVQFSFVKNQGDSFDLSDLIGEGDMSSINEDTLENISLFSINEGTLARSPILPDSPVQSKVPAPTAPQTPQLGSTNVVDSPASPQKLCAVSPILPVAQVGPPPNPPGPGPTETPSDLEPDFGFIDSDSFSTDPGDPPRRLPPPPERTFPGFNWDFLNLFR